jgi:hypothetical protein
VQSLEEALELSRAFAKRQEQFLLLGLIGYEAFELVDQVSKGGRRLARVDSSVHALPRRRFGGQNLRRASSFGIGMAMTGERRQR